MTVYYHDSLPAPEEFCAMRRQAGSETDEPFWKLGDPQAGECVEAFRVGDVECQIGQVTVARWEADIARVLSGKEEIASPLHKAMSGTLVSIAVCGDELLENWKRRLRNYPDALAEAMVRHHLQFFPIWALYDRLKTRDAGLWMRQILVESSFNILGVLSGVNRKFFTTFQFKRASDFIRTLPIAPPNLAQRLEGLWTKALDIAAKDLQQLVRETVDLVEQHMPQIDLTASRKSLARGG